MGFPQKGRADFLELGDWNVACSMCGRKRKASDVMKNWQGLYRCPEHNEPRQPQDFVRNVKDVQTVPFAQPETQLFITFNPTFPLSLMPASLTLVPMTDLVLESGPILDTEGGIGLAIEGQNSGTIQAIYPNWITPESIVWSWQSGGVNLTIVSPGAESTRIVANGTGSGILLCTITSTLGVVATSTAFVTT